MTLFIAALLITITGTVMAVISVLKDISFPVMGTDVSGAVWGTVIAFLGIRYLFSVQKLKAEVYKSTAQFSFQNFKK